ncbi:NAD-dependent epimerase/dehydratase family protein [Inquilinus sp. YAF38]|uniref:NAD-dependent epimerase/dehydratase family protein n=1 Tax=Inquilinus sp. YAF38 TaxID=3233084 RepID=UPI003F8F6A71
MRILITGAAGFIGSQITRRLARDGHEILAIDNLSFGRESSLPGEVVLKRLDLGTCSSAELMAVAEEFQPDGAIHFAAIHFIPYCMSHPDETFATNVRGTELVLRALERTPARKVVFASTMDVYAAVDRVHRETDQPAPVNAYGLSKLLGEDLLAYATRTNDRLSGVALRFANAFGPGETNPHLIPDALARMRDRSEPEIRMGYLGATRDFIHVSDIAEAAAAALFQDTGRFEVFNVASSVPTPVRDVVEIIRHLVGDARPVVEDKKQFRKFDRPSLSADTGKIRSALGWTPKWSLEEGLRDLVQRTLGTELRPISQTA